MNVNTLPSHPLAGIDVFPINALPASQLVAAGIDEISHRQPIKWEAVRRYYEQLSSDLLFFFSDIAIQAEAMGATVRFDPAAMPAVSAPACMVATPRATQVARMTLNAGVVASMRRTFAHRRLAALVYGPFTVAGQLIGEQKLLRNVRKPHDQIQELLNKATHVAEDYACLLLEAGADVLWISDPLAALLPPDCFEAFAGCYLQQLFRLKPDRASILHICGDIADLLPGMLATGAGGISIDQCMAMPAVEDRVRPSVALIGNLDPMAEVTMGTIESVSAATRELTMMMGVRSNFILSTGCALPPKTPLENIRTFIETGRTVLQAIQSRCELLTPLSESVSRGDEEKTVQLVDQCIERGYDAFLVINAGLMRSIRRASALYEAKRCYLPEILSAVEAFYSGIERLGPGIKRQTSAGPQVILGTVRGDLHAIGKDLVRIMLEANGFDVLDLGVDVSAEQFGDAVGKYQPKIVGLSAFITSAREQLPSFIETIRSAAEAPLSIVLGGAAVNNAIASQVGADGYAREAVAAVRLVRNLGALSTIINHESDT